MWIIAFQVDSLLENAVNVIFYGDRTTAKLNTICVFPFEQGIQKFIPVEGKQLLLQKAVKEALYEVHRAAVGEKRSI